MRPSNVIRYLRSALGPDADGASDADLLARFAAHRDETAFELIVWRHAGMVLRVCRGVLRDHHAAEDATQAAFLALAKQAKTVGRSGTIAGWLYRVARRISVRAAKRHRSEANGPGANFDQLPARTTEADYELTRLLHDELDRLPEKYRTPVLLCYFEGLTHADAARRLGWPVGTVATRVARAKDRLHRRLAGRGVTVPAAGTAALFAAEPVAAVGPAFAGATARAAAAFVDGSIVGVPEAVLTLTQGELQAMTVLKLRMVVAMIAIGVAFGGGGMWMAGGQDPAKPDPPKPPERPPTPIFQSQKALLDGSDLRDAFVLDVYKFRVKMPRKQRFRIEIRRQTAETEKPITVVRMPGIKYDDDQPVEVTVSFTPPDGSVAAVLRSDKYDSFGYRISCTGCERGNLGGHMKSPLAGVPDLNRASTQHGEYTTMKGDKEVRLVTAAKCEDTKNGVLMTYPRLEVLITEGTSEDDEWGKPRPTPMP